MDRTKVMDLADKVGGLFRLTVLLQKRVRELVAGAPRLVDTKDTNPINIAMLEVEQGAIELVDLSEEELAALEVESQMASEEAEILEALRSRVSAPLSSSLGADDEEDGAPRGGSSSIVRGGSAAAGGEDEDDDED